MLGILPPEIAKLIHVYVFEDVLNELRKKTKILYRNTQQNFGSKYDVNKDVHFFINGKYGIIWNNGNLHLIINITRPVSPKISTDTIKFIKRKLNFLKKHNRETVIECKCGKKDSIIKYNEEDFEDNGKIRCINKEKIEKK